jgi:hypothetical protein
LTSTWRNIRKVQFRLQQAATAEPAGWDIVTSTGTRFARGEAVWLRGHKFQYGWLPRLIPPNVGIRVIVWLFVAAYVTLILAHTDVLGFGRLLAH